MKEEFFWRTVHEIGIGKKYLYVDPDKIRPKTEIMEYCSTCAFRESKGLFITGPIGVGKTSILSYIAFKIIESGEIECIYNDPTLVDYWSSPMRQHIRYCPMQKLFGLLFNTRNLDMAEELKEIEEVKYLLLDDFGSEYRTAFLEARFEGFVETRYSGELTTIIASNTPLEVLAETPELKRTVDRFREMMNPLIITGESMRRSQ